MYWITSKGVDYLTHIIDNMNRYWSDERSREEDVLGELEYRGGGFSSSQIVDYSSQRDIPDPLIGTREQYLRTINKLERRGYLVRT